MIIGSKYSMPWRNYVTYLNPGENTVIFLHIYPEKVDLPNRLLRLYKVERIVLAETHELKDVAFKCVGCYTHLLVSSRPLELHPDFQCLLK